ncbi:hypothetical protein [Ferrimonas pelagia]
MTQTRNADYMAAFTPEQLAFFYGFPAWVDACWAIAVWGGVLGAVLLLLRRGLAAPVLLTSWVMMVLVTLRNYVFANGLEVVGDPVSLLFTAVIFVIAFVLYGYARWMRRRGVLQ